jgi:hypothetical protein
MKKKYTLTLDDDFIQYCKLNNIDDIDTLAKKTFNRGFTILKYGETPMLNKKQVETPKIKKEENVPTKKEEVEIKNKTKDIYGD